MKVSRPGFGGRKEGGRGGRRVRFMDALIDIGPQKHMWVGSTVFATGTVRLSAMIKRFPGRRQHRTPVPSMLIHPAWSRA